ncbi:MAG: beta-propeller domain-containing protein [Oscillospiraceae bacterium]
MAGALNNQFSLDERDGYLRMATTEQTYAYSIYRDEKHDFENTKTNDDATQTRNDVYVLDSDLNTVGSVAGLAEGETVFSARFDGDYGYLCTYRQTDPVFAVDLTDPANPKVVGELKLSGYSDYLHVWSGCFSISAWVAVRWHDNGMKLVMIDTSDPAKLHDLTQTVMPTTARRCITGRHLVDTAKSHRFRQERLPCGYSADDASTAQEIPVSRWD